MSPSQWLTAAVTLMYVGTALAHAAGGRSGLALAFGGYALANIGLIMAENQ